MTTFRRPACFSLLLALAGAAGCHPTVGDDLDASTYAARLGRRQYWGAPPIIPHEPFGVACAVCHTETGKPAPGVGIAPANPHIGTKNAAAMQYCHQCHVFARTDARYIESTFEGLMPSQVHGERLHAGAPPVMPHRQFMRENCRACHTGPAARAEIRCTHAERINCSQCHIQELADSELPPLAAAPVAAP